MTFNQSKLISGRTPVTDYGNLTADRYQFLSVNQAEPNLGPGANSTILTITTSNTRVWSSSFSVTGNIGGDYVYGNGRFLTGVESSGGSPVTNQTISGDGTTTVYTLTSTSTADAVLVTTNGLTQAPDVDYTVSGNTITFTTAPAQGDIMQIRYLSNNLITINNNYGNSNVVLFLESGNGINISTTGNISTTANVSARIFWVEAPDGVVAWSDETQEIYKNTVDNYMDIVNHVGGIRTWAPSGNVDLQTNAGAARYDYNGNFSIPNKSTANVFATTTSNLTIGPIDLVLPDPYTYIRQSTANGGLQVGWDGQPDNDGIAYITFNDPSEASITLWTGNANTIAHQWSFLNDGTFIGYGNIDFAGNAFLGNVETFGISTVGNIQSNGIITSQVYTVSTLPVANVAGAGARAFVSNANTTTFYSVVGTGGSNTVPVFSDGTNWRVG